MWIVCWAFYTQFGHYIPTDIFRSFGIPTLAILYATLYVCQKEIMTVVNQDIVWLYQKKVLIFSINNSSVYAYWQW